MTPAIILKSNSFLVKKDCNYYFLLCNSMNSNIIWGMSRLKGTFSEKRIQKFLKRYLFWQIQRFWLFGWVVVVGGWGGGRAHRRWERALAQERVQHARWGTTGGRRRAWPRWRRGFTPTAVKFRQERQVLKGEQVGEGKNRPDRFVCVHRAIFLAGYYYFRVFLVVLSPKTETRIDHF